MNTLFGVDATKNSLLLLWTKIVESSTKTTDGNTASTLIDNLNISHSHLHSIFLVMNKTPIMQALFKEGRFENYSKWRNHRLPKKGSYKRSQIQGKRTTLIHANS